MKNAYLYSYLPLFSILLFSLTFGIFTVGKSIELFHSIGLYSGMREFFTDGEIRMLLLFVFFLCFFMLFSALKLVGETVHEIAMAFFLKDSEVEGLKGARWGYLIFFFGGLLSSLATQSVLALIIIFSLSLFCSYVYTVYQMSQYMSLSGLIGLIAFEILFWAVFLVTVAYVCVKLYNGIVASLPFAK